MTLRLVPNRRTMVRGYFLDTLEKINHQIVLVSTDGRDWSSQFVLQQLNIIKKQLSEELDKLTNDITIE